jgi:hypothetical protein
MAQKQNEHVYIDKPTQIVHAIDEALQLINISMYDSVQFLFNGENNQVETEFKMQSSCLKIDKPNLHGS